MFRDLYNIQKRLGFDCGAVEQDWSRVTKSFVSLKFTKAKVLATPPRQSSYDMTAAFNPPREQSSLLANTSLAPLVSR
jgi:hypothetical protein